jgi:DNA-binding IclR family transcriptional regulator
VAAGRLRPFTDRTVTDPIELRRRLHEVRRSGFAVCEGEVEPSATSLAAPV